MRGLTQASSRASLRNSDVDVILAVHRGYPWCKGPRTGGEEDKQGNGEYTEEVQRSRGFVPC
jgi:hypothetical protein